MYYYAAKHKADTHWDRWMDSGQSWGGKDFRAYDRHQDIIDWLVHGLHDGMH